MPGGDRTGPAGMGPMTGRAAGVCAGNAAPGYVNHFGGIGYGGWSRGGGRGRRNLYYATSLPGWARAEGGRPTWGVMATPNAAGSAGSPDLTTAQTLEALEDQAKSIEETLNNINRRIEELRNRKGPEEEVGQL